MPRTDSDGWMSLVVDGGGSKTVCGLLRHAGTTELLGRGRSSGSNPATVGVESAVGAIVAAVDQAVAAAGLGREALPVERAAFAIAGTLDESQRSQLQSRLAAAGLARACRVFPDVLPVVLAASPSGVGAALIAGTGSVAIVRTASGHLQVTGGWGYLLGDEGSGFDIGRHAVRQVLQAMEAGDRLRPLSRRVLAALDADRAEEVKRAIYRDPAPRQRLAAVAQVVMEAAAERDGEAQQLVAAAAAELVHLLGRAMEAGQLDASRADAPLGVAVAGGLMAAGSPLRQGFADAAGRRFAGVQVHFVDDPLVACQRLVSDEFFAEG